MKKLISYTRSANKLVEAIKSITKGINSITAKYLPALNLVSPEKQQEINTGSCRSTVVSTKK